MTADLQGRATAYGQTFVYNDSGEGPLVVLLHGFPDTPESWDGVRGGLNRAGFRTVAPYLRGYHRETIVEGRPFDGEAIGTDALRLLDALGEKKAVLVGHDWGAFIAYAAASLDPGRVRAIVPVAIPHPRLLQPSPRLLFAARHFLSLRLPSAEWMVRRNDFAYLDTLYRRWAPSWSGADRDQCLERAKGCFRDPVVLRGALSYYRAVTPRPPASVTARTKVPGLVVGGTEDITGADIFRQSPGAFQTRCEVVILEGAGHWPQHEAEDRFMQALLPFLKSLD